MDFSFLLWAIWIFQLSFSKYPSSCITSCMKIFLLISTGLLMWMYMCICRIKALWNKLKVIKTNIVQWFCADMFLYIYKRKINWNIYKEKIRATPENLKASYNRYSLKWDSFAVELSTGSFKCTVGQYLLVLNTHNMQLPMKW